MGKSRRHAVSRTSNVAVVSTSRQERRTLDRRRQQGGTSRPTRWDADPLRVPARIAVSELVALRWDQVDLARGTLHVNRRKNGEAATHPLSGHELRALRQVKRAYLESPFLFVTERGGPITDATVRKIVDRAGRNARIEFPVHPHMLRHATGFYLANNGVDTRFRPISGIATSCTPFATHSSHPIGFELSGATDPVWPSLL